MTTPALVAFSLVAALAFQDPAAATEARVRAAWQALEVDRDPRRAATLFAAIADATDVPRACTARSLVGLARCHLLLGERAQAESRLRAAIERFADSADVQQEARPLLQALQGSRTRFLTQLLSVHRRQYVDLDLGVVLEAPRLASGTVAELEVDEGRVRWLVPQQEDATLAACTTPIAAAPWQRAATDQGRTAWVQMLASDGHRTCMRIVTRLGGTRDPLPAPAEAFCLGEESGIAVHFTTDQRYRSYRVERRIGPKGPFLDAGVVATPPFADRDCRADVRYGYRITGVTESGDEGLPAQVQGTTRSRGVLSGVIEVPADARGGIDLLRGAVTDSDDRQAVSDLLINGPIVAPAYGQAAAGGTGRFWDQPRVHPSRHVSEGDFLVLLDGGGIGRAAWTASSANDGAGTLSYEVDPDADAFVSRVQLAAGAVAAGARVAVQCDAGWEAAELRVEDAQAAGPATRLDVADGHAADLHARPGTLRRYTATARDRHGRRSSVATVMLDLRADAPIRGSFTLCYKEGYSFARRAIVPPSEADVRITHLAGGISSVTLGAPRGIADLSSAGLPAAHGGTTPGLFARVVRVDPDQLDLVPEAHGDNRDPRSDVFVLRLPDGGFAKLMVQRPKEYRRWDQARLEFTYVMNPRSATFDRVPDDAERVGGLVLAPEPEAAGETSAGAPAAAESPARPAPPKEVDLQVQEFLLSRARYDDYEKATFSFRHGARDDPGLALIRNHWDVQFGNGGDVFSVRMVVGDQSMIVDLGAVTWPLAVPALLAKAAWKTEVPAIAGHLYLVTTLWRDYSGLALFRVRELRPGDWCRIEWVAPAEDGLRQSPGLELRPQEKAAVAQIFARAARPAGLRYCGADENALSAMERFEQREIAMRARMTWADLLADLGPADSVVLDESLRAKLSGRPLPDLSQCRRAWEALQAAAFDAGLRWWMTPEGKLMIAPPEK